MVKNRIRKALKPINLPVCGLTLALEDGFCLRRFGFGQLLVQIEHLLYEFNHPVAAGFVGRIGEVDGADGEVFKVHVTWLKNVKK